MTFYIGDPNISGSQSSDFPSEIGGHPSPKTFFAQNRRVK